MVTIGAYLSEMAPKHLRGKAFACSQTIGFSCVPVASFLAYILVPTAPLGIAGWRWVVLIGVAAAALIAFLRLGLPESPRWLARQGRLEEADRVLRAIEDRVQREYGAPLPAPGPEEPISPAASFARSLGSADPRPRHHDERLQYFSDRRLLRLPELGADAAGQPGRRDHQEPRLHDGDRARRAGRAADRLLRRRPDRAQVRHRRRRRRHPRLRPDLRRDARGRVIIAMGLGLQLANNIMSYSFHAYQQELFPTGIRARAAGFVYSWSRLSVIFSSFIIAFLLHDFGAPACSSSSPPRCRGDGDDRVLRPADQQRRAGADFAVGRRNSLGAGKRVS